MVGRWVWAMLRIWRCPQRRRPRRHGAVRISDGDAFDAGFLRVRFACGGRLPPLRRTRGFLLLIGLRYKPGVRRSGGACAAMGHCVYGAMRHLIACFLRVRFVCGGLEAAATEKLGAPTTNQRLRFNPDVRLYLFYLKTLLLVFLVAGVQAGALVADFVGA